MMLRDYQQRALDMLYSWFQDNKNGNPVLAMPGGSGKSVVIAAIAADAVKNWPDTRVLMLVRSQELVAQNADKLRKTWPNAPLGIVCASLGKSQWGEPITYASPDSVARNVLRLGHQDLVIIDESHMVSAKDEGRYRQLLASLWEINPSMRVIGFSASPYRLGHGMITDGQEAIFSAILEPVSIEELVYKNHLTPLRSKHTAHKLNAGGLRIRQGDYIQGEMQEAYNTADHNQAVALEMIERAADRKHWLIFCSGREHAKNISETLNGLGIPADWIATPISKSEREAKLKAFETGKIRALCNVGILTTGYDFPALDCIAFLRSTMSPGLYLQMAVRGMRPNDGKSDCLVLDFAGVVQAHGPITAVEPPKRRGEGNGEAPVKVCDACNELVHISAKVCPTCGEAFPVPEPVELTLHHDDIMGVEAAEMTVQSWHWRRHTSRASGKDMLLVSYYGGLSDPAVSEYFPVTHDGYAGQKALAAVADIAQSGGVAFSGAITLDDWADRLNAGATPATINYRRDGKFYRVLRRAWA